MLMDKIILVKCATKMNLLMLNAFGIAILVNMTYENGIIFTGRCTKVKYWYSPNQMYSKFNIMIWLFL